MPHLFPPAVSSSEDVFTALPYAKGRRYFDAVALSKSKPFSFFRQLLLNLQTVPEMANVLKPELWQIIISLRSRTRKI